MFDALKQSEIKLVEVLSSTSITESDAECAPREKEKHVQSQQHEQEKKYLRITNHEQDLVIQ
mgnify:CR=1 FL=1